MLRFVYLFVAIAVMALILLLLRSRRLREKYAALWIMVGLAIVLLAIAPGVLYALSRLLGFEVPSNLLFVLAIFLLLGVALHLSLEISRLEDETRVLAENVAILNLVVTEAGLTDHLSHDPTGPAGPVGAVGPVRPVGPVGAVGPVRPVGPTAPAGPVGPVRPTDPTGRDHHAEGPQAAAGPGPADPPRPGTPPTTAS